MFGMNIRIPRNTGDVTDVNTLFHFKKGGEREKLSMPVRHRKELMEGK